MQKGGNVWDSLGQLHRLDTGMWQISVFDANTLDELVERLLAGTLTGAIGAYRCDGPAACR